MNIGNVKRTIVNGSLFDEIDQLSNRFKIAIFAASFKWRTSTNSVN